MSYRRRGARAVSRAGLISLALLVGIPTAAQAGKPPAPRLVVVISVDQLGSNLFDRYRARFRYGLKRLTNEGVVFPNGYQSHAATETCPGHSTMLTGRHPAATGIVANSWYDKNKGAQLYCVNDPAHPVPGRPGQGRGPANLKVPTLGEWMRAANPESRTVSISGKDRASITMAGHDPTGVFWWDDERGFTTSVPVGMNENARLAPVSSINATIDARWRAVPPRWVAIEPTCAVSPETRRYGTLNITHSVPPPGYTPPAAGAGAFREDGDFKKWLRASPVLDEVTIEAASALIENYDLGRRTAPDLLTVSLSATDYVGHRYGNDGPEMCDQIAHLDKLLGRFLDRLDGLGVPVLVALTADHGAADASERAAERGASASRFDLEAMVRDVGKAIQAELKLPYAPLAGDGQQISVVGPSMDAAIKRRIVAAAIRLLTSRAEVEAVFTRDAVRSAIPPKGKAADELSLIERFARSVDMERSGDLMVAPKPHASLGVPAALGDTIAGHGTPWNYDRRVPILFWWKGAEPFEQSMAIATVDIAPTLASALDVPTPPLDGTCRDLDRTTRNSCSVGSRYTESH